MHYTTNETDTALYESLREMKSCDLRVWLYQCKIAFTCQFPIVCTYNIIKYYRKVSFLTKLFIFDENDTILYDSNRILHYCLTKIWVRIKKYTFFPSRIKRFVLFTKRAYDFNINLIIVTSAQSIIKILLLIWSWLDNEVFRFFLNIIYAYNNNYRSVLFTYIINYSRVRCLKNNYL